MGKVTRLQHVFRLQSDDRCHDHTQVDGHVTAVYSSLDDSVLEVMPVFDNTRRKVVDTVDLVQ